MKMFEKFKNWIKKLFSWKNESVNYPYCSEYPYDKFNENNLSSGLKPDVLPISETSKELEKKKKVETSVKKQKRSYKKKSKM